MSFPLCLHVASGGILKYLFNDLFPFFHLFIYFFPPKIMSKSCLMGTL